MKNTLGTHVSITLFGESHGPGVGCVLDGVCPGLPVSREEMEKLLARRRPAGATDTPRRERDAVEILSGVFEGRTTGTPLCIFIRNEDTRPADYTYGLPRPGQADYGAFCKYHGFEDYRGGGHFSGRLTAALCAAGGILIPALREKGIGIVTHIAALGGVKDDPLTGPGDGEILEKKQFPVLSDRAEEEMLRRVREAAEEKDSVGGVTETAVFGLPAGLGEPWFDSAEGLLSHGLFSVGGIKAVAFGAGFGFADKRGSEANDPFCMENGRIVTKTNHNGGINGGITNGMPVVFSCAVKPTPSIGKPQDTVDFRKKENTVLTLRGRHDPTLLRRICPVVDSLTALVLADLLTGRFGTDWFTEKEGR